MDTHSAMSDERVIKDLPATQEFGEPLFLTKYIESGEIEKARVLSISGNLPNAPNVLSHSGFFTVKKEYNSNIFFWFFPAMNNDENAPLLLWLQGGPGVSLFFGFFTEHGPYVIDANMNASIREYNWAKTFNLLYIDNPVGTGFSFTDDDKGYVTSQEEMADDVYEFIQQFLAVFPELRKNDFYVAGESYAGKYVPSVAYKIHSMGPESHINLKGVSIGNGMCDPETMTNYADYLYTIGLVDEIQANVMRKLSSSILNDIKNGEYYNAGVGANQLIFDFEVLPYVTLFKDFTGFDFYYNFTMSEEPEAFTYYPTYMKIPQFKKALHVGNFPFQDGNVSQKYLFHDIMQSVKPKVAVLMDNYRVLFYNGQLDVIIPYPLTLNFLKSVQWKYAEEYRNAKREIWRLSDNRIAGYVHNVKDFYEVLVRNAGHILPHDQPLVAFDLITRFIKNQPFS